MGFTDRQANLQGTRFCFLELNFLKANLFLALTATMGDVNVAIERLLSQI